MTITSEIWLMIAIIGLYLYDSALLVFSNEVLFIPSRGDRWTAHFGSPNFGLWGKELFVPNPLGFHRPIYRMSWSYEKSEPACPFDAPVNPCRPLVPLLWGIAAGLFVFLPLGFFSHLRDDALLAGLALIFGNILAAVTWIALNRQTLQLSLRRVGSLAFESIVCPPFALNLIRHIALDKDVAEDAILAAHRLCSSDDWEQARMKFVARINGELELEAQDSERHSALVTRRDSLPKAGTTCQE